MKKYKLQLLTLLLFTIGITIQLQNSKLGQVTYAACASDNYTEQCNIIVTKYIAPAINFLSVGVGVIVLAMIIVGAIQYITAGGNPQSIAAARKKIINAILALVLFALTYAVLNFIIPGGIVPL